jgi:hypothetical protein
MAERRSQVWPGASPSLRNVTIPALLHAEIVHADAGSLRELLTQQRSERLGTIGATTYANGSLNADLTGIP